MNTTHIVILHADSNETSSRGNVEIVTEEEISYLIIDMVQECRSQGVSKIVICILICGRGYYDNFRVNEVSQILSKLCHDNSFHFIDMSGINQDHLRKVGLHLQESGKIILARKFNLSLKLR